MDVFINASIASRSVHEGANACFHAFARAHTFTHAFNQRQKKLTYRKRAATVWLRPWVQTVEKRARTSPSQQELRAAVLKWFNSYMNP